MKGVNTASDHHVLVVKLKLKQEKNYMERPTQCQKYNTCLLKDTQNLQEYKATLNNNLQVLQEVPEEETLDSN